MTKGMFDLTGRVAVVTGSSGQLGKEYVRTLLGAGACVAGFDLESPGDSRALDISDTERLLSVKVDITSRESIGNGMAEVYERFGTPCILVNNAAIDAPPGATEQETGPFETYPESSWDKMMQVNLKGVFLMCQVVGGQMARAGRGSIINIASIYGILSPDQRLYEYRKEATGKPFFKPASYSVTKSGIVNFTRYLATYWGAQGVRVNTLTLGGVYKDQDKRFVQNYNEKVPLGRMAHSHEYNGAVLFLASDASSYMTGSNMVIDGGFSSW